MALKPSYVWQPAHGEIAPRKFICGYSGCEREVGSNKGWFYRNPDLGTTQGFIYICPICHRPTFLDDTDDSQIPGVSFGRNVEYLPDDVSKLYQEIRRSTAIGAHTIAILGCRKMLMHIAVERGAQQGLHFIEYVRYLVDNHFAPPGSEPWVDRIKERGNEANHEIKIMQKDHADELINFIEMLLKFIYEFSARVKIPAQIKPIMEISQ